MRLAMSSELAKELREMVTEEPSGHKRKIMKLAIARIEALEAENARLREALDSIGEGRPENPVGDPWAFYDDLVSVARRAREGGNADG